MKLHHHILSLLIIFLVVGGCKKDDPSDVEETIIYLSDNAKTYFAYNNSCDLTFSDTTGSHYIFHVPSGPNKKIAENNKELWYLNLANDSNNLKILYELAAWEDDKHYLVIGFFIEPEPQYIEVESCFKFYTDIVSDDFSFNSYDKTYNQHYDTLILNQAVYYDVYKLWGTDNNPVDTVFFNREIGIVGFHEYSNKLWNLEQ